VWLDRGGTDHARFVAFPYPGYVYHDDKSDTCRVRAVRNAP